MASPQIEGGYTRIANELFDAILRFPFSKREHIIILSVIRKTYGYNKKEAEISNWKLSKMTGIDRWHVSKTISELSKKAVLTVHESGTVKRGQRVRIIGVNKHYNEWQTVHKAWTVNRPQNGNRPQNVDSPQSMDCDRPQNVARPSTKRPTIKDSKDIKTKPFLSAKRFTDEDLAISKEMFLTLQSKNPGHKKPNFDAWSNDVRKTREIDKRSPAAIRELFAWAQADAFWQNNILSPKKLREKWDQLTLKRKNQPKATHSNSNGQDDWAGLGKQLGVTAKRGETMQAFINRVQVAMGERSG